MPAAVEILTSHALANGRIDREHKPRPANDYHAYLPCLRWEFGFRCAFCGMHELDVPQGVGPGGRDRQPAHWTVEHIALQSVAPDQSATYSNTIYCCRFCNGARSKKPLNKNGAQLLNPCDHNWSEHFCVVDDAIAPVDPSDPHSKYTFSAYDLGNARLTEMRSLRRQLAAKVMLIPTIQEMLKEIRKLLENAELASNWQEAKRLTSEQVNLQAKLDCAFADAQKLVALTPERPATCRCATAPPFHIPPALRSGLSTVHVG